MNKDFVEMRRECRWIMRLSIKGAKGGSENWEREAESMFNEKRRLYQLWLQKEDVSTIKNMYNGGNKESSTGS